MTRTTYRILFLPPVQNGLHHLDWLIISPSLLMIARSHGSNEIENYLSGI